MRGTGVVEVPQNVSTDPRGGLIGLLARWGLSLAAANRLDLVGRESTVQRGDQASPEIAGERNQFEPLTV